MSRPAFHRAAESPAADRYGVRTVGLLDRLGWIIRQLCDGERLTADAIAERYGCCRRTAFRYLGTVRRHFFPVCWDGAAGTYRRG